MQLNMIGQKNNLEMIDKWEYLPNFIIIQGEENSGKEYLTLYLCKKFKLTYVPIKNSVKEVRSLIQIMTPNSNTLYHFKDFDKATMQAKNALLKITEEPIAGNYIVITGGPQIKTLESRARKIIMEPYSYNELKDMMSENFNNIQNGEKLYRAGINTPAKIIKYKDYKSIDGLLNFALEIFERLTYLQAEDLVYIIFRFQPKYEPDEVDSALLFLNMLINLIQTKLNKDQYYSYYFILAKLIEGKNKLLKEKTLNRKFLMFNIFYQIYINKEKL